MCVPRELEEKLRRAREEAEREAIREQRERREAEKAEREERERTVKRELDDYEKKLRAMAYAQWNREDQ